jgi:hypothetical protein
LRLTKFPADEYMYNNIDHFNHTPTHLMLGTSVLPHNYFDN